MSSGIRDTTFAFTGRILALVISTVYQLVLAWNLGVSGRGAYAVCMVFSSILFFLSSISTDTAGVFFMASKRGTSSQVIANVTVLTAAASLLGILAAEVAVRLPVGFFQKADPSSFQLAIIYLPVFAFFFTFSALLTGMRLFQWDAFFTVLARVLELSLAMLFLWGFAWGTDGALLAMLVGDTVAIASLVIFLIAKCGVRPVMPSLTMMRAMLSYGIRSFIGKISSVFNMQIGLILLGLVASREDTGLFAVAVAMIMRIDIIPNTMNVVLTPRVAATEGGRANLVAQMARLTGLVCGILAGLIAILAPWLVKLLLPEEFSSIVLLVRVMAIGVIIRSACKPFIAYLIGTDHPGLNSLAIGAGVIVNAALLLLLMPLVGLLAAALAMFASHILTSVILAAAFGRISGMKARDVWRFRRSDWSLAANTFRKIGTKLGIVQVPAGE